jgi:hypothetical protein
MQSTMYRLVAPHVSVRMLQDALTTVDLTLDPLIGRQYRLAQVLHRSLTADYDLAQIEPTLNYDPNHQDADKLSKIEPAVYQRQALYSGLRDIAVEALTVGGPSGRARCQTYGEFETAMQDEKGLMSKAFGEVYWLFHEF